MLANWWRQIPRRWQRRGCLPPRRLSSGSEIFMHFLHELHLALQDDISHSLDLDPLVHKLACKHYPLQRAQRKSLQDMLRPQVVTGWHLWIQLQRIHHRDLSSMFRGWALAAKLQHHRRQHRRRHRQARREHLK